MLKRLFVLAICMSFGGDVMAANFAGREFDYYDFSSPTTGYALWNQVIDSFKSDEFINSARSENEWEESAWKVTFESFFNLSIGTNLFRVWWGIPKRKQAGEKVQEVSDYLKNQATNIEETILEGLEEIYKRSIDTSECKPKDWNGKR